MMTVMLFLCGSRRPDNMNTYSYAALCASTVQLTAALHCLGAFRYHIAEICRLFCTEMTIMVAHILLKH